MEDSGDWLLVRADGGDGNTSDDGAQELGQLGPSTPARSAQAGTSNSLPQQEQPQGDESADVTSDEDTCKHEEVKAATVQELHEPELQLPLPDCLPQPDDVEQQHAAGQLCTPDAASSSTADAIAADSSFAGPQPAQRAVQPWPAWLAFLLGPACAASSAMPDTATERDHSQGNVASWLSSAGEAVDTVVGEVREECAELVELLKQALQAGQGAAAQHARMLRVRFSKALNGHAPSWALVSLSAVTALTLVALGTLLVANHRLANQVKQRDKELARLVLRIMSLQGAMQSSRAAVPVIRLTALQPAYAISSLG